MPKPQCEDDVLSSRTITIFKKGKGSHFPIRAKTRTRSTILVHMARGPEIELLERLEKRFIELTNDCERKKGPRQLDKHRSGRGGSLVRRARPIARRTLAERTNEESDPKRDGGLALVPLPLVSPELKVSLKDLLKPEEVAHLPGPSIETLAQWRSQRRGIPYLKIGRSVPYARADVQAYLEGCRVSVSVPKERRQM